MPTTSKPQDVIWVVSTHWDREWYEPFQHYRWRLVHLLDALLGQMESDPAFTHFQMDGQSIPVEDYLEIRPEKEALIKRLAQEGRFALGPWFVQPDEFLPSGESLVRNLQLGRQVARRFGVASNAGFVCDIFGHNGQMPQILNGFGIDNALLWRGINEADAGGNFRWQSPDGSEVVTYRFGPRFGYCDFVFWKHDYDGHTVANTRGEIELTAERIEEYLALQAERTRPGMPLLVFDGGDHVEADPATPHHVAICRTGPTAERYDVRMGTLDDYARLLAEHARTLAAQGEPLPVVVGELRAPAIPWGQGSESQWLIPGVLSSRIPLKQANARCEALLTQWAEPFSALAAQAGLAYPHSFIATAWKHLLTNHAHDSICGCSIDQVHKDMEFRFDQALLIGTRVRRSALEYLGAHINLAAPPAPEPNGYAYISKAAAAPKEHTPLRVVVFNPTSRAIDEPVDLSVELPTDSPMFSEFFGFEAKPGFRLFDAEGAELPYQRTGQAMGVTAFERPWRKFPKPNPRNDVAVTAQVRIPAFGYTTLSVRPAREGEPTRHGGHGMQTGPRRAENELLALEFTAGGMLNITDKRTGQVYAGLLELEDRADIGDGWYHGVAVNDQVYYSGAAAASIGCVADGPLKSIWRVEVTWELPERFDFKTMRRVEDRTTLRIVHEVTLRAGSARVEVQTHVDNALRDHRLRVLLPSGAQTDTYLADAPFEVVERPIALNPEQHTWRELEVETKPQQSWTAAWGGERGLAVIARGLPESAVLDQPGRPIALTLYRSFQRTVFTDGEPGGQLLRPLQFNYWLAPLAEAPRGDELCWLGQRLAGEVQQAVIAAHQVAVDATLPPSAGLLEIEGAVVVTAVKAADDGALLVRLFNSGDGEEACTIRRPAGIARAAACNLEEVVGEALPVTAGELRLTVPHRRIMTLRLEA